MMELWPEAFGGVNGAVTPKPGALAVLALLAHVSKLLSPVVAALIAPTIPPLQCPVLAQKNQIGEDVWVISRV